MTTNNNSGNRLQELKGSDFEIADGEPDIRGWAVRDEKGEHLGKVKELIFDVEARKVRYMVVNLDKDAAGKHGDVLIPIGLAELHNIDEDAFLPGVTSEQLALLPGYDGDTINVDAESRIRSVFGGTGTGIAGAAMMNDIPANSGTEDFYDHEHFNENNFRKNRTGKLSDDTTSIPILEENLQVGKKMVETGGAYIRSRIVEKPVEETVVLQEEHVSVERTPVNRVVSNTELEAFTEGEIELKEYAEVPVVSKEARVVEEITVGKEVQERDETIRDTVRKTEVDIEQIPASDNSSVNTSTKGSGY